MKKKAILFILSDFIDKGYEKSLKIVGKKHDVTGIRIFDPKEVEIPNLGLISVWDAESGSTHLVDTSSSKVRTAYKAHYLSVVDYFKTQFTHSGAGVIHNRTDEDYVKNLLGYFKK
jgi:hypothetical protein